MKTWEIKSMTYKFPHRDAHGKPIDNDPEIVRFVAGLIDAGIDFRYMNSPLRREEVVTIDDFEYLDHARDLREAAREG